MPIRWFCRAHRAAALLSLLLLAAGCASSAKTDESLAEHPGVGFPPHEAMEKGTYNKLLADSQKAALECSDELHCATALFNLGFLYSYPQSPYFNEAKGLYYLEALIKSYPRNPLASEAKAWREIIKRCMAIETSKQRLKGELKSKSATIKELQRQAAQPKTVSGREGADQGAPAKPVETKEAETEAERMEKDIRIKLEQSQEIDAEIDRRERELLQ